MVSDSVNKFAREGCDTAETLQKIQRDALSLQNRPCQAAHFDNSIAGLNFIAIAATNLDIRRRIDLPKNFRSCSGASNDGFFTRNDASGCVQCFWHEKVRRHI